MNEATAYISVGSNMGDPLKNCRRGINALTTSRGNRHLEQSAYYRTEPVDYTEQEWFVNAAVAISTAMPPRSLLKFLKQIERDAGRVEKAVRFGPRMLDLDILLYDDLILESPDLTIPHPRMHQRRFVLQPVCDINPRVLHPIQKRTVAELLGELAPDDQRIVKIHA